MDDKAASKKPLDTPFRQQTLKAWRPILTPKAVIVTFSIVGIIFIPIGCVILSESDKVVEVENDGDYGDACCLANDSLRGERQSERRSGHDDEGCDCDDIVANQR